MHIVRTTINHSDERGTIRDILTHRMTLEQAALLDPGSPLQIEHVALMTCIAGSVRGNHYHRTATAYIYVLSGRFMVAWRNEGEVVKLTHAHSGDLVVVEPGERHALHALADSMFLMLVHTPNGGSHFAEGETVAEVL